MDSKVAKSVAENLKQLADLVASGRVKDLNVCVKGGVPTAFDYTLEGADAAPHSGGYTLRAKGPVDGLFNAA
jgi:hypothetical protein